MWRDKKTPGRIPTALRSQTCQHGACVMNSIESALIGIFGNENLAPIPRVPKCTKCATERKSWKEFDPHHVTYVPRKIKYLCQDCHAVITYRNFKRAREIHRRLDTKERTVVWDNFLVDVISKEEIILSVRWFDIYRKREVKYGTS